MPFDPDTDPAPPPVSSPTSSSTSSPVSRGAAPAPPAADARAARRNSATAVLLVVIVGLLMQAGSAVAVLVIESVGVIEAVWLRTALAAFLLAIVRPRSLRVPAKGHRLLLVALTLSLVAMNYSFYQAISHAPVGIAVAIEFLGPLGVAVAGSRRPLDLLWVVFAGAGIAMLAGPGGSAGVAGLLYALLAAVCWASFILLAKRAVSRMEPLPVTVMMLVGATIVLTPVWLVSGVKIVGHGHALLLGLAVALLSSALPYFLELAAIKRVRASTYGVLLSIEPAIAALMGFLILSQGLSGKEIGGIVAIVIAAAGASYWASSR